MLIFVLCCVVFVSFCFVYLNGRLSVCVFVILTTRLGLFSPSLFCFPSLLCFALLCFALLCFALLCFPFSCLFLSLFFFFLLFFFFFLFSFFFYFFCSFCITFCLWSWLSNKLSRAFFLLFNLPHSFFFFNFSSLFSSRISVYFPFFYFAFC